MWITAGLLLLAVLNAASMNESKKPTASMEWLPKGIMLYDVYYYKGLQEDEFIEIIDDGFRIVAKVGNKVIGIYIGPAIFAIYDREKRQVFLEETQKDHYELHYDIPSSLLILLAPKNPSKLNPNAPSFRPARYYENQVRLLRHPNQHRPGVLGPRPNQSTSGSEGRIPRRSYPDSPGESS